MNFCVHEAKQKTAYAIPQNMEFVDIRSTYFNDIMLY